MSSSRLHLLLVEDDDVDVELMERVLRGAGARFTLAIARNGHEALAMLRGENGDRPGLPALILLDLRLPVLDGLGFLQSLREDPTLRQCIVFVLSNSNLEADRRAVYQYNVAGYLLKARLGGNMESLLDLLEAYRTIVELPFGPSLLVTPHMERRLTDAASYAP